MVYQSLGGFLNIYIDIFRIKFDVDPPAKVKILKIKLEENHRPIRSKQRRYTPMQRAFLENTLQELRKVGAIHPKSQARCAITALAVPKLGTDKFRFTVDLRARNRETVPLASEMLDLEQMTESTAGSKYFAKLNMCHACWQIRLQDESREFMSIQTPLGVDTPVRLLQVQTDSGNHFQSVTSSIFNEIIENVVQWLYNFCFRPKKKMKFYK